MKWVLVACALVASLPALAEEELPLELPPPPPSLAFEELPPPPTPVDVDAVVLSDWSHWMMGGLTTGPSADGRLVAAVARVRLEPWRNLPWLFFDGALLGGLDFGVQASAGVNLLSLPPPSHGFTLLNPYLAVRPTVLSTSAPLALLFVGGNHFDVGDWGLDVSMSLDLVSFNPATAMLFEVAIGRRIGPFGWEG